MDQFVELKGDYSEYDRDPYADSDFTREPITEQTQVVIVGAGFAGMLTAVNLLKRGVTDFRIIDKAGDFGGTWYWNRYPGCMCDVESYTYLPLLEETGYMPTMKYAGAPEIFAHCQRIGEQFDLYSRALFQTEVATAEWDESTSNWQVVTSRGDHISSRFLVTAGGILSKAKLPGIPGIETFAGKAFHTSRWDYNFTGGSPTETMDKLKDKRVGIIGTGATAVQVVPRLAETAKEVFVFQRTPSAVGERNNGPTDAEWYASLQPGWQAERIRNFTQAVTGKKPEQNLVADGWTEVMWEDTQSVAATPEQAEALEQSDFDTMEALRQRVARIVEDPETADKLMPWYGKHCKRVCFHDEYLPAFNKDNVHLVDTDGRGVESVTPTGLVVNGVEYPIDVLVFASGFEVTTDLNQRLGFDPVGRNGVAMSERWNDGAHTLHGVLAADFPNMLMISIVQAGFGTNFLHFLSESANHVSWVISRCIEDGITTIEATPEAEEAWHRTLIEEAMQIAGYSMSCTPGYYNSEQGQNPKARRNLTYTGSLLDYVGYLERWRDDEGFPGAKLDA
jgi:cation diffusion facilitator CzcD-associated flavoprotein CzcO